MLQRLIEPAIARSVGKSWGNYAGKPWPGKVLSSRRKPPPLIGLEFKPRKGSRRNHTWRKIILCSGFEHCRDFWPVMHHHNHGRCEAAVRLTYRT